MDLGPLLSTMLEPSPNDFGGTGFSVSPVRIQVVFEQHNLNNKTPHLFKVHIGYKWWGNSMAHVVYFCTFTMVWN